MKAYTRNDKQNQAINSEKDVIVIAGAGAGKTETFINRFKRLEKLTDMKHILVLTYTEKASDELKRRIDKDYVPYLGTFHSVFYKLFHNFKHYRDIREIIDDNKTIYEESRYNYYLEQEFKYGTFIEKEFLLKVGNISKVDKFINKNMELALKCDTYSDYVENMNILFIEEFNYSDTNVIEDFLMKKQEDNILNFDDIIIETYFLIKEHDRVRNYMKNWFKYIMIDEFQDTNMIVLSIIDMIKNDNAFYVGDTLQSIYSFQGASYEYINNMVEDCDNLIQLDTNYRSSANIVNYANRFIDTSIKTKSEKIRAIKDSGLKENNEIEVVENITDYTIPEIIFNSKEELNDICILSRNNNHLREITDILKKHNVPFNVNDYFEIENILNAMLLMITDNYEPKDKYFDRFNIENWKKIIENNYIDNYIETIKILWKNEKIANYLENRKIANNDTVNLWIDRTLKAFSVNREVYLDNVRSRLKHYLNQESYISCVGVNVSTIHKAKGLEWNSVILYNQEDNVFPKDTNNEEEARLYYVAITRAKENLYITSKGEINTYTKKLLNEEYVNYTAYKRDKELELEFKNAEIDIVSFHGESFTNFYELDMTRYENYNDTSVITNYVKGTNNLLQNEQIKNINTYNEEDLEIMLLELEEIKKDNEIDFIPLKEMVEKIDTTKSVFFTNGKINYNYINNDFTKIIHEIINYRSLMTPSERENESKLNNAFIRKFGKIVKRFVSKKNTDLTKDKSKKSLEIQQRRLEHKINDKQLETFDDTVNYMIKEFTKNSDIQKQYFNENILGMEDGLNGGKMIDLTANNHRDFLIDTAIDYEKNYNGKYKYTKETLAGKFLLDKKKQQAIKRWSKLKYHEYKARGARGYFLTFTSNGHNHKWQMTQDAINNKSKRVYGDSSILYKNPDFIQQGDNYIEHIKITAKQLNEATSYFYKEVKNEIDRYTKKHNLNKDDLLQLRSFKQSEPHKNLLLHNHYLFYIDEQVEEVIEIAFNKTIEKYNLNPEFQKLIRMDKKEDTEKGRELIKYQELEDAINIYEFENEEIIELEYKIRNYFDIKSDKTVLELDFYMPTKKELRNELRKLTKNNEDYETYKNNLDAFKKLSAIREKRDIKYGEKLQEFDTLIENADTQEAIKLLEDKAEYEKAEFKQVASVASYMGKYMLKGAFSEDGENTTEEAMFFSAWENILGNTIKITTMSNYDFTTQKHLDKMYLWYQQHNLEKLKYLKSLNKPLYISLEELELSGEFRFEYERRVKENFKNADFLKDIEAEYTELKNSDSEADLKDLYELAKSKVLSEENDYTNIMIDKKLIGFYVSEDFIKENIYTQDEFIDRLHKEQTMFPDGLFLSEEEEYEAYIDFAFTNIVELNNKRYKLIYEEDMYIKCLMTPEDIMSYVDFTITEEYFEQLRNYPNHKDNMIEKEKKSFIHSEEQFILDL